MIGPNDRGPAQPPTNDLKRFFGLTNRRERGMPLGGLGTEASPDDILMAEWKEARSQIDALDGTISGIRKNGFAFITALLAADSILGQATNQASFVLSPQVKLGVMVSTLVLVIGQYATDSFYSIIQQSFAKSASQIERGWIASKSLHQPGPTMVVGIAYHDKHGWAFVDLLYILFGVADLVLGYFILQPDTLLLFRWLVAAGAAALAIGLFLVQLSKGRRDKLRHLDLNAMMAPPAEPRHP